MIHSRVVFIFTAGAIFLGTAVNGQSDHDLDPMRRFVADRISRRRLGGHPRDDFKLRSQRRRLPRRYEFIPMDAEALTDEGTPDYDYWGNIAKAKEEARLEEERALKLEHERKLARQRELVNKSIAETLLRESSRPKELYLPNKRVLKYAEESQSGWPVYRSTGNKALVILKKWMDKDNYYEHWKLSCFDHKGEHIIGVFTGDTDVPALKKDQKTLDLGHESWICANSGYKELIVETDVDASAHCPQAPPDGGHTPVRQVPSATKAEKDTSDDYPPSVSLHVPPADKNDNVSCTEIISCNFTKNDTKYQGTSKSGTYILTKVTDDEFKREFKEAGINVGTGWKLKLPNGSENVYRYFVGDGSIPCSQMFSCVLVEDFRGFVR